eukprot:NODE_2874_length_730_cov_279.340675_g2031_i0.p2 GENE.NODE_2874_length_730_cov_279.340675_g2031_i0~~NODE_2874_length_730_cov_279.340675_g2031_i0.p2  ORF type:complete len:130 (-),score=43.17 NODE_2874_length_730_cov_279.340675_g2031_i0:340-708(-)
MGTVAPTRFTPPIPTPGLALAATLDSRYVASSSGSDGAVFLWNVNTGQPVHSYLDTHAVTVRSLATTRFSLVSASDDQTVKFSYLPSAAEDFLGTTRELTAEIGQLQSALFDATEVSGRCAP